MRRVIVLYGATGYTGQLVTRELVARGADFALGGRSRDKLESLSRGVGGGAPVRVASVHDEDSLRALMDGADVLINCAGPFTHAGEPVVRAAVEAGVHYVDSTGEQPFIRTVFETYGPRAAERGVALVPACGFDYVPGDCIARIAARGLEPVEELVLAYSVQGFGMSRGTLKSGLEMMKAGSAVTYRDGRLEPVPGGVFRASFDFPEPIGRQPVIPYPAGEPISVPSHTDVRTVTTLLSTRTAVPGPMVPVAPYAAPLLGQVLKTPLRPLLAKAVDRLPEGPPEEARRAARWTIVAQAHGAGGRAARAVVRGSDVYGLTARSLVWAAERLAAEGYERTGALGPAGAFDAEEMLGALSDFGVEWSAPGPAA
ncbi:MAG: hypothetical protein QOJ07_3881 [Thermoleophilaceae bacterium]|nr:hypothetical protein [Thermoleophilaceae bacterium]